MSKKTTQLEVEITALIRKINGLQNAVDLIREQLGYTRLHASARDVEYAYFKPDISVSKKVDGLFKHLNLEIKKIQKEEKIIVHSKRASRAKGGKDATKKQKE